MRSVAELFPNSYGLLPTKGQRSYVESKQLAPSFPVQLSTESCPYSDMGRDPEGGAGGVGATLVVARPRSL